MVRDVKRRDGDFLWGAGRGSGSSPGEGAASTSIVTEVCLSIPNWENVWPGPERGGLTKGATK